MPCAFRSVKRSVACPPGTVPNGVRCTPPAEEKPLDRDIVVQPVAGTQKMRTIQTAASRRGTLRSKPAPYFFTVGDPSAHTPNMAPEAVYGQSCAKQRHHRDPARRS